ncbi:hypothetical protein YPPY99_0601, partial [Yersinia pestis PY-99]
MGKGIHPRRRRDTGG